MVCGHNLINKEDMTMKGIRRVNGRDQGAKDQRGKVRPLNLNQLRIIDRELAIIEAMLERLIPLFDQYESDGDAFEGKLLSDN